MNQKIVKLAVICLGITCLAAIGFYAFPYIYQLCAALPIWLVLVFVSIWLVCLVILALRMNQKSVKLAVICLEITCLVAVAFYAFPYICRSFEALPMLLIFAFVPIWLAGPVILVLDVVWIIVVSKRLITKNVYLGIFLVYLVLLLSACMFTFLAFLQLWSYH